MDNSFLRKFPYLLSEEEAESVSKIIDKMTLEEKIGQLFFVVGRGYDEEYLAKISKELHVGGIMLRPLPLEEGRKIVSYVQKESKIPLFVAANLEAGPSGAIAEATNVATSMMIAATGDSSYAYELGRICGEEARAVGAYFSFAPVSDIDFNFRNPITNTRTFGSNQEMVKACALNYIKGAQEAGLICSAKHFPGDGRDERDQHLVTSINDLSPEEWDKTYGEIYGEEIKAGVLAFMSGHIALPQYSKKLNPSLKDKDILPGSLSEELLVGLLREKLSFNGMILTDATTMAGFNIPLPRNEAVPVAIAHGNDMFLFSKNLEEDYRFMMEGYRSGIISESRLNEALQRILGLKMKMGLFREDFRPFDEKTPIKTPENLAISRSIAEKSLDLVKEEEGILPINPSRYPRVLLHILENGDNPLGYLRSSVGEAFKDKLEGKGFKVTVYAPKGGYEGLQEAFEDVVKRYDLIIYLANLETRSNQTTVRIEWTNPMGVNVPIYPSSIPTIFISLANPYHLLDVPRVRTYINAYGKNDFTLDELIARLMGEKPFLAQSPVDPFCGKWDTHL